MRAALELFDARNYASVVAVCDGALIDEPDNKHLRLLKARALLALRLDAQAQQELSDCLHRDPKSPDAYRLLSELALRRNELKSAEIFAREALRLDPGNQDISELLGIIESLFQPTAAVEKLPAATVAVGCPSPPPSRGGGRGRFPAGSHADVGSARAPAGASRFGAYLVEIGALTQLQLKAALAYHRSTGVRLGAAAAALGFISEPKVEWAAHAFHGRRHRRSG
jgi:tetratricopeptide (TPR) repeat protein